METRYGVGQGSGWFSVPLTVAGTKFNLTVSNTLEHTWIPSTKACDGASNKTACQLQSGGMLSSPPSGTTVAMAAELKDLYDASLHPAKKAYPQSALALKGKGVVAKQKITVLSNTGTFDLPEQSVGVFTEGPDFNGYISLRQVAQALADAGSTPGSNYHLYIGQSAATVDSSPPDNSGYDAGRYVLIFGGYDQSVWDFNTTQQYRLGSGGAMGTQLEELTYRWTADGATDNSILGSAHRVVIDTTTPYVWLPQKMVDQLVQLSGASWNETMGSYAFAQSCSPCSTEQDNSAHAVLDLVFSSGQKITVSFSDVFKLQSLLFASYSSSNYYVMPIRALANDADPIVLGRAMMASIHLWVDYDADIFSMAIANTSNWYYPEPTIVPWGSDHPPITNTTILAADSSDTSDSSSSHSSHPAKSGLPGDPNDPESKGVPMPVIAGAAGGVGLALLLGGILFLLQRRRKRLHPVDAMPGFLPPHATPSTLHANSPTSAGPGKPGVSGLPPGEYYKLQELDTKVYPTPPPPAELPPAQGGWPQPAPQYVYEVQGSQGHPPPQQGYPPPQGYPPQQQQGGYQGQNGGYIPPPPPGPPPQAAHPAYAQGGYPPPANGYPPQQQQMVHEMPAEPWP